MEDYRSMITTRLINILDEDLVLRWANDAEVRKNSFSDRIIQPLEHREWFRTKVKDSSCIWETILFEEVEVGQVRIDFNGEIGIINYSIDKNYRGKGIGSKILKIIKEKYSTKILLGKVKYTNRASIDAFRKAGYVETNKDDYIEFKSKQED